MGAPNPNVVGAFEGLLIVGALEGLLVVGDAVGLDVGDTVGLAVGGFTMFAKQKLFVWPAYASLQHSSCVAYRGRLPYGGRGRVLIHIPASQPAG